MEHKALDNARASFAQFEDSQNYTYLQRMHHFVEGVDWLTELDGTPLEPRATRLKKTYTDKLIKDIPFPLNEIIMGWLAGQPVSYFRKFEGVFAFDKEENLHNAVALITALDAAL